MIEAIKAALNANPALSWVFILGLLGIVAFLAWALKEAFFSLVKTKQEAIQQNIARADDAIKQNQLRSDQAIARLEEATSGAIDDIREAQKTASASFNAAIIDIQKAIQGMAKIMNQSAANLHEKVNASNTHFAEFKVVAIERLTAVEGEVKAHKSACAECGRLCPHRNQPLVHGG